MEDKEYTIEEAQAAIEADKRARIQELNAIIVREAQRLRVDMQAVPIIAEDGRIVARIQFLAR